eukprot:4649887-Amphidinium_carterae.1
MELDHWSCQPSKITFQVNVSNDIRPLTQCAYAATVIEMAKDALLIHGCLGSTLQVTIQVQHPDQWQDGAHLSKMRHTKKRPITRRNRTIILLVLL